MSKSLWEALMERGYDRANPPSKEDVLAAMDRAPPMIKQVLQDVLDRHYPEEPRP